MTAHWNRVGWPKGFPQQDHDKKAKVMELHLRKTDIFMDLIKEGNVPLRPGVLRVIDDAIANDLKLAICSTSAEKAVRNLVQTLFGPDNGPPKFKYLQETWSNGKSRQLTCTSWLWIPWGWTSRNASL
jgi:hypothetical protein